MLSKKIILFFIIFLSINFVYSLESAYGPEIERESYIISRSKVERILNRGDLFYDYLEIENLGKGEIEVSFSVDSHLSDFIEFDSVGLIITPQNSSEMSFLIKGKEIGNFTGKLFLSGDINHEIPVNLTVFEKSKNSPVFINVDFLKKSFVLDKTLDFKLKINKLKPEKIKNATISYYINDIKNNSHFLGSESLDIFTSFHLIKNLKIPEDLEEGFYSLRVVLEYENRVLVNESHFLLRKSFFNILFFGFIPMWLLLLILGFLIIAILAFWFIKRSIEKKKKYKMMLDLKTIPKKNPDFLFLGKIAETNVPAYLDPNRLTTHSIVAGATGGGKSISAQVIIEEALMHNIAVIVFDPTAQWSGMLRKCTDKKMMSYYPKFGLKEADSKAFKGNVRQVKNARQIIDINKYINPGQIQIFTLNKLDPNDIDIFVASIIRQIFRADPKESPNLKLMIVFDEVHRLLSKFGGSGEGFLQVERACREFRKWGMGVMLVSQVLSDFVGEIKANISTEVQMRTRDEGDLKRIETKYGDEVLKSLVKASVGVGMFVNPAYNHAKPYFVNFRPILHNTRRLSDEELEKYNKYNDIVDDLEYQLEQLEKEKVD
ncbi:DUF87 domain-containing protein, partial [Candidatus Pacearchaeota archaeon]|nr:DUF87 domain-containing protein [Candidatus Pacearchaeota archaeon]MBD3283656.1 DUF87 domain-containing protein [Candidatus Pacearchaeota archaeon]